MSQKHVSDEASEIRDGQSIGVPPAERAEAPGGSEEDPARAAGEVGAAPSGEGPMHASLRESATLELEAKELSLTPQQATALMLLDAGQKKYEVAYAVKVSRHTLHRWMTKDAAFMAAYNACVNDALASVRAKLKNGLDAAADTLLRMVRSDGKLAYKMLKDAGLIKIKGGTLCVEELRAKLERLARKKKAARREEEEDDFLDAEMDDDD